MGVISNLICGKSAIGGNINTPRDTLKYQNDMSTFESADDVLTLLVHLGYLTAEPDTAGTGENSNHADVVMERILCSIPNSEVRQEFINCIEDGGWENVMDAIWNSEELLRQN